jgi:hypothetical protein
MATPILLDACGSLESITLYTDPRGTLRAVVVSSEGLIRHFDTPTPQPVDGAGGAA